MKVEDVEVADPQKAMQSFKSALGRIMKAPKAVFKSKHKHTAGRRNKIPKP